MVARILVILIRLRHVSLVVNLYKRSFRSVQNLMVTDHRRNDLTNQHGSPPSTATRARLGRLNVVRHLSHPMTFVQLRRSAKARRGGSIKYTLLTIAGTPLSKVQGVVRYVDYCQRKCFVRNRSARGVRIEFRTISKIAQ
jgi:hypothetical protein